MEISQDQIRLLNPTPRDVQMAAIIDQCSGRKAVKVIAKRRIEFIDGNVNSYARVLNGPDQLKQIKIFNQLSASIGTNQRQNQAGKDDAKEKKNQDEAEKSEKKAEKERKAREEHDKLAPVCKEDVEKGIEYVLNLTNIRRKEILKIHFGLKNQSTK